MAAPCPLFSACNCLENMLFKVKNQRKISKKGWKREGDGYRKGGGKARGTEVGGVREGGVRRKGRHVFFLT